MPPIVRGAACVLVVGSLARESVLARGADPARIGVFANTIDVAAFGDGTTRSPRRGELRAEIGLGADDVVVLSVARLAPEKGLDALVRAVAAAGDPRLVLVVAGAGPSGERLETSPARAVSASSFFRTSSGSGSPSATSSRTSSRCSRRTSRGAWS